MTKFFFVLQLPMMEKYNLFRLYYYRLKTNLFYKILFLEIGSNTAIFKPLFLAGLKKIKLGSNILIRDGARIEAIAKGSIIIGDDVSIEQYCHLTSAGTLTIGSNSTLSFDVMITTIDHEYQIIDKHILQQPYIVSDTYIGDNCFIGSGAKIQAGVRLGKQCIVGANSVVRGVFPDYCVIVGAPAKIVKRFNPTTNLWEKVNPDGSFKNE